MVLAITARRGSDAGFFSSDSTSDAAHFAILCFSAL